VLGLSTENTNKKQSSGKKIFVSAATAAQITANFIQTANIIQQTQRFKL